MNLILEFFFILLLVIYYWLEVIVLIFILVSLRGKSVVGEIVFVIGVGKLEIYFLEVEESNKNFKFVLRKLLINSFI